MGGKGEGNGSFRSNSGWGQGRRKGNQDCEESSGKGEGKEGLSTGKFQGPEIPKHRKREKRVHRKNRTRLGRREEHHLSEEILKKPPCRPYKKKGKSARGRVWVLEGTYM